MSIPIITGTIKTEIINGLKVRVLTTQIIKELK